MNSIMQSIVEGRGVRAQRSGCLGWLIVAVALAIAAPALAGDVAAPTYLRMKKVEFVDEHSFEKPLVAWTLLLPPDWSLKGKVAWDSKNTCVATSFRASSPDGRTAVEAFPADFWSWWDNPAMRKFIAQERQVKFAPPLAARDYLSKYFLPRARPGARVVGAEVDPETARAVSNLVRQAKEEIAKAGTKVQLRADTARLHIAYDRQGQSQEEWLSAPLFPMKLSAYPWSTARARHSS